MRRSIAVGIPNSPLPSQISEFRPGARAWADRYLRATLPGCVATRPVSVLEALRSGSHPRKLRLRSALPASRRLPCSLWPPPPPFGCTGIREMTFRFVQEKSSALPKFPVASPLPPVGRPLAGKSGVSALLANASLPPPARCSGLPLEFMPPKVLCPKLFPAGSTGPLDLSYHLYLAYPASIPA